MKAASIRKLRTIFAASGPIFCTTVLPGISFPPSAAKKCASSLPRRDVRINETLDDLEAMLYAQLLNVSDALESDNKNLSVRANYGTGILSSVLGAELFILPDACNTLPTTRPLAGQGAIERLLERGMPSLTDGLGSRVFSAGELFREVFARYPKIEKYVEIYHPDLQGPLDICELMWGEDLFYAMYDEPELVAAVMQLITDTYMRFMERWQALVPPRDDICCHWDNVMHRGQIVLRNDSAMNLSPEFYDTFARAFDSQLMERYGMTQEQVAKRVGKSRPAIANACACSTCRRRSWIWWVKGRFPPDTRARAGFDDSGSDSVEIGIEGEVKKPG